MSIYLYKKNQFMRGFHYSIRPDKSYFMTMTVVEWINVFTTLEHNMLIVDSLKHCQKEKGLNIFAWCLMPSHLHLIANTSSGFELDDVIRDFKKFTSKKLVNLIIEEGDYEGERMVERFYLAGRKNKKIKNNKFWQDGNHAIEVYSEKVTWQKINYVHQNPVKAKIVSKEEDYIYSSARNYYNLPSLLHVDCLTPPEMTVGMPGFFRVRHD